jgi:hypothetical protein
MNKKRKINHTCEECDSEYVLHYDEEICEDSPSYCAFCGSYIIIEKTFVDDD